MKVTFPLDKISRWEAVMLKIFVSWEHAMKTVLYRALNYFQGLLQILYNE